MKKLIVLAVAVLAVAGSTVTAAVAGGTMKYCLNGNTVSLPVQVPYQGGSAELDGYAAEFFITGWGGNFVAGTDSTTEQSVVYVPPAAGKLKPGYSTNHVSRGACSSPVAAPPPAPPRGGFCAVAGNVHPYTGVAIRPGTYLDLGLNQPATDPAYKGALPANFVEGKGLTCDPPPAGFVRKGTAGDTQHVSAEPGYPLWVKG